MLWLYSILLLTLQKKAMISFPNAKINLGLYITGKRDDGFHNIETVFYPVSLCDILEIIVSPDNKFLFQSSGMTIPGDPDINLCVKAYNLLAHDFELVPVKIHLHKRIPVGAGLGGGSSDAAHTLILLNKIFKLDLSKIELKRYASELGSDCAFFIENKPKIGKGKGDELSPVRLDLNGYHMIIIKPDLTISTAEAYSLVSPKEEIYKPGELVSQSPEVWKDNLFNDFESPIFIKYPEIRELKEMLYDKGAVYAAMSGSGSAVYGIFKEKPDKSDFDETHFFWEGTL